MTKILISQRPGVSQPDPLLERFPPCPVVAVPVDRGGQRVLERAAQRPAEGAQLGDVGPALLVDDPRNYQPEVLDPFIDDMTQQVSRSLQFFLASGGCREQPDQVLVCGGCANIPGVADVISSKVGIPTEIGDPLGYMKISSKAKSQGVRADATSLLTAFGLALRSFD